MEEPIDGLCDWPTHLNQLEEKQLQLHSSYYWPANKDSLLQASKNHY